LAKFKVMFLSLLARNLKKVVNNKLESLCTQHLRSILQVKRISIRWLLISTCRRYHSEFLNQCNQVYTIFICRFFTISQRLCYENVKVFLSGFGKFESSKF